MDVPAAWCECLGQSLDSRAGTPRKGDQPLKLAGDRSKNRRAPSQELDRYLATFFNLDQSLAFSCLRAHSVSEVAGVVRCSPILALF